MRIVSTPKTECTRSVGCSQRSRTGYNNAMEIKELSQAMQDFVTAKGWYEPDTPKKQTPRNIAISLSLEASEVLEHFQWA